MLDFMKVALIQGGMSAEREVSLNTGKAFQEALVQLGIEHTVIDAGPDLPQQLAKLKPSVALLAVHGKHAEDGTVQGLCEYMKIPYTGAGVMASALCMNKYFTKQILSFHGLPTPDFEFFNLAQTGEDKVRLKHLEYPVVVKPSREGSTVGISIAHNATEFRKALTLAHQQDSEILIEEFIPGMELTVSILDEKPLTPIEIVPQAGFYDYQRKYTAGKTEYILPPRLPEKVSRHLQELALKVHQVCQVRCYSRVDFRLTAEHKPYVLEINTLPGCTKTSLLPKAAAHDGIDFAKVIQILLTRARLDYEGVR
jgi:D-alanine-D-alanine ligase